MSEICVVGSGYVGLVTGTCFADLGNNVVGLDIDAAKVERLSRGELPIYEPGLAEILRRNSQAGRLRFTSSYPDALANAEFIFIAVDTPSGAEGEADMSSVRAAARSIGEFLDHPAVVVNKSTVPIGTGDLVSAIVERTNASAEIRVVSNPEFLREGSAVHDFMNPDRIVLGATDRAAAEKVAELYSAIGQPQMIITDLRTAEMIKYASNAFLATKISFINEIASICDRLGADVKEVARGMGLDKRIGSQFLDAGLGFGGSCFPKDVRALSHMAAVHGCHPQMLRAVLEINRDQRRAIVQRLRDLFNGLEGVKVGLFGLSFKPNTDDMREAASVELVRLLRNEGAICRAYDPAAAEAAAKVMPRDVELCPNPYAVAEGADAVILVTEWNEFKQLNLSRIRSLMRRPVFVDGRNLYDPEQMAELGFFYFGVGRGKYQSVRASLAVGETV